MPTQPLNHSAMTSSYFFLSISPPHWVVRFQILCPSSTNTPTIPINSKSKGNQWFPVMKVNAWAITVGQIWKPKQMGIICLLSRVLKRLSLNGLRWTHGCGWYDLLRTSCTNLIVYVSWGCAWSPVAQNISVRISQFTLSIFDSISLPTLRRLMINIVNEHHSLYWLLHNIKLDSTDINLLGERYATTVSGWM